MKLARGGCALLIILAGCEASDTTIDPGDLSMRDLLGFEPDVALHWDASQRAAARDVIAHGLADTPRTARGGLGLGVALDERVAVTLADIDDQRAAAGDGALGLVRVHVALDGDGLAAEPVPLELDETAQPPVDVELSSAWEPSLVARASGLLAAMALDVDHDGGPLLIEPAPRLAVAAAYVDAVPAGSRAGADGRAHLLVNPVILAALDPVEEDEGAGVAVAQAASASSTTTPSLAHVTSSKANPYSFYGSVDECAYAEQERCEACRPDNSCQPRTVGGDGNAECDTLAADPAGYAEWCINQSLAIGGVSSCVADAAPSCTQDQQAVRQIDATTLAANATFMTDSTCGNALDRCLADLYGGSTGTYPPQGGTDEPRNTSVGCGDSSPNCTFDPSCNVSGPSCNNSLSCSGGCADSPGGGDCSGCSSSSDGGTGGDCSSCGSSSSSGGGGCGSCDSSSSSGGSSCGSCDSSSSGGGGGCSGGSCDSGSSGGGCGGGDCGGSSSSTSCSIAASRAPVRPLGLLLQVFWALIPVPFALRARKRRTTRKEEVKS